MNIHGARSSRSPRSKARLRSVGCCAHGKSSTRFRHSCTSQPRVRSRDPAVTQLVKNGPCCMCCFITGCCWSIASLLPWWAGLVGLDYFGFTLLNVK